MLAGKVAVVTGASRGIGKAIAIAMAKQGASVAVLYAGNEQMANDVCGEIELLGQKAKSYRCNVADFNVCKEVVDAIVEDFGGIDILVNNAGINKDRLIMQMTEEDFDSVIDINLKGAFNMTKQVFMVLAKKRAGRIINIASVAGIYGTAGQANYAASKAGLIGLTKTTARELAARQVTCNAIAPGLVETDMTAAMKDIEREKLIAQVPIKRMGQAEEVANVAVFLASDLASYITGEVIRIDGGMCI